MQKRRAAPSGSARSCATLTQDAAGNNCPWFPSHLLRSRGKIRTSPYRISRELPVDPRRREVLKTGGGVLALAAAAGIIKPSDALAQEWNKAAFDTKSVAETVKALGGSGSTLSSRIEITAPDIAENGALVAVPGEGKPPKTQDT